MKKKYTTFYQRDFYQIILNFQFQAINSCYKSGKDFGLQMPFGSTTTFELKNSWQMECSVSADKNNKDGIFSISIFTDDDRRTDNTNAVYSATYINKGNHGQFDKLSFINARKAEGTSPMHNPSITARSIEISPHFTSRIQGEADDLALLRILSENIKEIKVINSYLMPDWRCGRTECESLMPKDLKSHSSRI